MVRLRKNQRLVYAGEAMLRAPDGTAMHSIPQYMNVAADEADPDCITYLQNDECLVLAGVVHNDRKAAKERFDALKAGTANPPKISGTPLYIKVSETSISTKSQLSEEEEKACDFIVSDFMDMFSAAMRKRNALDKQKQ